MKRTVRRGAIDPRKFENVLQVGGICTGTLDTPGAGGGKPIRVAWIDTGSGLRFAVALDRGGDILQASYNRYGLAYLSPNGVVAPSHAYHTGAEWLRSWAGGLVTTCGPEYIGGSRLDGGTQSPLHGRFSNLPAMVGSIQNPEPARGRLGMQLGLIIQDTRVFGPVFEIRRTLRCTLGEPEISIVDKVTNRGNTPVAHHWLYHCNLGYPLLDEGAKFVIGGEASYWIVPPPVDQDILQPLSADGMERLKRVPGPLPSHAGAGERGLIVTPPKGRDGWAHAGLINHRFQIGIKFSFPVRALPRIANWQHYGPGGSYACALEPFYGSLLGAKRERQQGFDTYLQPGRTRRYELRIRVLHTREQLCALEALDSPLTPAPPSRNRLPTGGKQQSS